MLDSYMNVAYNVVNRYDGGKIWYTQFLKTSSLMWRKN